MNRHYHYDDVHKRMMHYAEEVLKYGKDGDHDEAYGGIYGPDDYGLAYRIFQVVTVGEELTKNWEIFQCLP